MERIKQSNIRNFCIIAHIDHGKSTLSDRILELTETVSSRDMKEQLLDSMDIERERGITIKSQAVRVDYRAEDGELYHFNLIDTPGHVDFTYEVSRSLAACEGAVLVVDATQGVEAQTVANAMMAMNANLEIIPLINKIDLPAAEPDRVREEIEEGLAIPADDALLASGKTGAGVHDLLERRRADRRGKRLLDKLLRRIAGLLERVRQQNVLHLTCGEGKGDLGIAVSHGVHLTIPHFRIRIDKKERTQCVRSFC